MANRNKKRSARSSSSADEKRGARSSEPEPFNNPFGASLKTLRRRLRDGASSERTLARKAAQAVPAEAGAPRTDSEEFLDAVKGSRRFTKRNGRVRARATSSADTATRDGDSAIDFAADEHFDVRFSDRYIRASADGVSKETIAKLARGEFAVRSHVDLHGMALDDARQAVDEFLAERQRRGERCVLVITGKGRNSRQQLGVLREKIPEWLARGPSARRVLAFVTARQCDGGEGALYVLLRKHAAAKARIDVLAGSGA